MREPWRSQKIWMAVLAVGLLLALSLTGRVELDSWHIVAIASILILGRAGEGIAAALRRPRDSDP